MIDILNIDNKDIDSEINNAVFSVKEELAGLTPERMCKVYSDYIYNFLRQRHILCKKINTNDLGFSYEHEFVLVPSNTKYLIDLTFSQFMEKDRFSLLIDKGYQEVDDSLINEYLEIVTKEDSNYTIDSILEEKLIKPKR